MPPDAKGTEPRYRVDVFKGSICVLEGNATYTRVVATCNMQPDADRIAEALNSAEKKPRSADPYWQIHDPSGTNYRRRYATEDAAREIARDLLKGGLTLRQYTRGKILREVAA